MYDSHSIKAAELLSYFGRNTAVTVAHNYGQNVLEVRSARTNNVIATVEVVFNPAMEYVDFSRTGKEYKVSPYS